MKKFTIVVLVGIMLFALSGCNKKDEISVYVPDGAPALSLVSVFDKQEIGGKKVRFTVVPSSQITSYVLGGEANLAVVPTNAAAVIYNKGYPFKVVSANTYGNLFVVGKEGGQLSGKVVGLIGRGQVPDLIFRSLLISNGTLFEDSDKAIEGKVALYYASDGGVLIPLIASGKVDCGLLGEPAATVALDKIDGAKVIIDIQEQWGYYPQACLIADDKVSDEFVSALIEALKERPNFALEHPSEALELIKEHMIASSETTIEELSSETVKRCNIRLVTDCSDDVTKLLSKFYAIDPDSVGGKLPDENFIRAVQ